MPGELKEINYTSQNSGEDLEIKIIYNQGKISTAISPASKNTASSGFISDSQNFQWFNGCPSNNLVVDLSSNTTMNLGSDLICSCSDYFGTILENGGFDDESAWVLSDNCEVLSNESQVIIILIFQILYLMENFFIKT